MGEVVVEPVGVVLGDDENLFPLDTEVARSDVWFDRPQPGLAGLVGLLVPQRCPVQAGPQGGGEQVAAEVRERLWAEAFDPEGGGSRVPGTRPILWAMTEPG